MNGDVAGMLTAESRRTTLAFACVAVWLAAAAIAEPLGIWTSVGGAAVALGVTVLLCDRPVPMAPLQPTSSLVLLGVVAGRVAAQCPGVLAASIDGIVGPVTTSAADPFRSGCIAQSDSQGSARDGHAHG